MYYSYGYLLISLLSTPVFRPRVRVETKSVGCASSSGSVVRLGAAAAEVKERVLSGIICGAACSSSGRGDVFMHPVLCVLPFGGGTPLWSYGLAMWTGVCVASLLYWYRYGDDARTVPSLFWGVVGIGSGFLLVHWFKMFSAYGPGVFLTLNRNVWIPAGDLAIFPGLLAGGTVIVLLYRVRKIPVAETMNRQAPFLAIAHAFARIGCFFAGCCYGKPAPEGWGVLFPPGSPSSLRYGASVPVWPVQLMESLFMFALALLLFRLPEKKRLAGYGAGYGAGRFVLEFFRGDVRGGIEGVPFSFPQVVASGVFLASVALLVCGMRRGESARENHRRGGENSRFRA